MTASATILTSSPSTYSTPAFWERLWRTGGIGFVAFFIIAYVIYPTQPGIGAPAEALVAFYSGERTRILIATVLSGVNILNLMWFAAALKTTLADAGQAGWGAAATASSAAVGATFVLLMSVSAALAYSIAGSGNQTLVAGMNDVVWAGIVLSSFPRAMLLMSAAFGLWRARLISNTLFTLGVAFVVLGVLGGTTWLSGGFWAPDGAYARVIWPLIGLAWVVVVSRVLLASKPAVRPAW